jgi:hypothetical protein
VPQFAKRDALRGAIDVATRDIVDGRVLEVSRFDGKSDAMAKIVEPQPLGERHALDVLDVYQRAQWPAQEGRVRSLYNDSRIGLRPLNANQRHRRFAVMLPRRTAIITNHGLRKPQTPVTIDRRFLTYICSTASVGLSMPAGSRSFGITFSANSVMLRRVSSPGMLPICIIATRTLNPMSF